MKFGMNMPLYTMSLYGGVLILVVLVLRAFLKKHLPKALMPVLWAVVLVRLLVPFSVSGPLSFPASPAVHYGSQYSVQSTVSGDLSMHSKTIHYNTVRGNAAMAPSAEAWSQIQADGQLSAEYDEKMTALNRRMLSLGLIWGGGTALAALVLLARRRACTKKLRDSLPVEENAAIHALLQENKMAHIRVLTNDAIASPLVCGIIHPRIYLPTGMDFANTRLLRDVLTHECTHIRRGDNLLKLVMLAALCLHWFNPLVWGMARWLSADIESACDESTLHRLSAVDPSARRHYASSLLGMAVAGGRPSLLYSAFSKTEVERRVRGVLRYKKAGTLAVALALVLCCGTGVLAVGKQAYFAQYLCRSDTGNTVWTRGYQINPPDRWAITVSLNWDAPVGENAGARGEAVLREVLDADTTDDKTVLADASATALADAFGVPQSAFDVELTLTLPKLERIRELEMRGITRAGSYYTYNGEVIRRCVDELAGTESYPPDGTADVFVSRDDTGEITGVTVLHEGDRGYRKMEGYLL